MVARGWGVCMVARGPCVVVRGHAWLPGAYMVAGGWHAWQRGMCVAKGGMHGIRRQNC